MVGVDVNAVNKNGWSALTIAAEQGWYRIACKLLEMGADVNVCSTVNWTPLMSVSSNGFIDLVELFLQYKAEVNIQQGGGWNALMMACNGGHVAIVKLLLKKEAKIFNRKEHIKPVETRKELDQIPDNAVPLIAAAQMGNAEIIALLCLHGADANTVLPDGRTPLMIAASLGHRKAVGTLRKYGAIIPVNDLGYTALRMGWVEIRGLLGAGKREDNEDGSTSMSTMDNTNMTPMNISTTTLQKKEMAKKE